MKHKKIVACAHSHLFSKKSQINRKGDGYKKVGPVLSKAQNLGCAGLRLGFPEFDADRWKDDDLELS